MAPAVYSDKYTWNISIRYKYLGIRKNILGPKTPFPLYMSTHVSDLHETSIKLQNFVFRFCEC
jgi:hypothetical protein